MKHTLFLSFVAMMVTGASSAATLDWWLRPTICKMNTTTCYKNMKAGYAPDTWDAFGNCWGKKIICADALISHDADTPLGRDEIANGENIYPEFDIDVLNGDCFGARKTVSGGAMAAAPDGTYKNVWCRGILANPDSELPNGDITFGTEPTCQELADDGWFAVFNKKNNCMGTKYDNREYHIDCDGKGIVPRRIIKLNGAFFDMVPDGGNYQYVEKSNADDLFDKMETAARAQHAKYFK